ncbi:MAG: ABC transporter ATP-binding protein [Propionibacteriaceae bacterium]|jgi:putative ABC transport system ATP-binding protein|nr:ABC transporter ATP-binding protein [Propionibacteriaceae bacterium]
MSGDFRRLVAELRQVSFSYHMSAETVVALREVSIKLFAGELTCLLGASGSGKSTLLNLLAGLDVAEAGQVLVDGRDVTAMSDKERTANRLTRIGMVFQENNLIAQFSARENVELILRCQQNPRPREVALELLASVGIEELAERRPADMSGGQRQRVGIARALAGDRQLLLCDEPTGNLDQKNAKQLFAALQELASLKNISVLVATHDQTALPFADRVLRMSDGELREDG